MKTIRFGLSVGDIQKAIDELEAFKKDFEKKVDIYRERVADEIKKVALRNFNNSLMENVVGGSFRHPDVKVSCSHEGNISVVVADGEDAVWCEFGAGIHHNGSAGSSPHPQGKELGFTIGSYGKGFGKKQIWGYYEDPDSKTGLVLTRGTPASMPMYNAAQEVLRKSVEIAREVFK